MNNDDDGDDEWFKHRLTAHCLINNDADNVYDNDDNDDEIHRSQ